MDGPILDVQHLSKKFCRDTRMALRYGVRDVIREFQPWRSQERPALAPGEFWALDDVSFHLERGEGLGIIGANGAGKSTLLRVLQGLTKPDSGSVAIDGTVAALINLGASFSGTLTGRENVAHDAALLGLDLGQTTDLVERVTDFAEIGTFIDAPIETYSSGMRLRLAYAIAAQMEPDLLIIDEVIAVGDLSFQRKCTRHVHGLLARGGSVILVSHDLWMVNAMCSRAMVLQHGRVSYVGQKNQAVARYLESMPALTTFDAAQFDADATGDDPAEHAPDLHAPVSIAAVTLTDLDGEPAEVLRPARLRIEVHARVPVARARLSFALMTSDDRACITANVSPDEAPVELRVGDNVFDAVIDPYPLFGGRFLMRAAVHDDETGEVLAEHGTGELPQVVRVSIGDSERETLAHTNGTFGLVNVAKVTASPVLDQ